jgi:hypothetical protein
MTAHAESPLDRICRESRERDERIVANPSAHPADDVAMAKNRIYQRTMLCPAAVLRYGD